MMQKLPLSFDEIPIPELRTLLQKINPTTADLDRINDLIWELRLLPKGKEAALLSNDIALEMCRRKGYKRGEMHITQSLLYYGKSMFATEEHADTSKRFLQLAQEVGDALSEGYANMELAYFYSRTDSIAAKKYAERCRTVFEQEKHTLGIAKCYDLFAKIAQEQHDIEEALVNFEKAYTSAFTLGAENLIVTAAINLGAFYIRRTQFEGALEVCSAALGIMKERAASIGREDTYYCEYHYFSRSATRVEIVESDGLAADVASNLGSVYSELGDLALALENFSIAYRCISQTDAEGKKLIIQFNIATTYLQMGDVDVAFGEFVAILEEAKKRQDAILVFHSANSLSSIYIEASLKGRAIEESGISPESLFADMEKTLSSLPSSFYGETLLLQKAQLAAAAKNWHTTKEYLTALTLPTAVKSISGTQVEAAVWGCRAGIALDEMDEVRDKVRLLEAIAQYTDNPLYRRQALEEIIAHKEYLLRGELYSLQEMMSFYDLLLDLQKSIFSEEKDRRNRNLQIILQVEKIKREAEEERRERERIALLLEQKRKELLSSALAVIRKNEMLEAIRRRILEVFGSGEQLRRQLADVANSISDALSADQEWQVFETQFKALNGEFMRVIEERYPNLSQQEIKIAALLRTGLGTKDIAKLFLLEVRTVENHRTSIRRKLKLDRKDDLIAYLKTV